MSKRHWLTHTERWLLLSSGLGTAASVAGQNVAFASAPLTLLVAVGLLNRNRVETALKDSQQKLNRHQQLQEKQLRVLSKQVTALPSPEALNHFQRAVMKRSNRNFLRLTKELKKLEVNTNERFAALPDLDLSRLYKDIAQLQDQYTYTAGAVESLTSYVQRLATAPRMEAAEVKLSQVKSELTNLRVHLESLQAETRTTVGGVQETLTMFEHRIHGLPRSGQPDSTKTELSEVVRAIANLVTQAEFTNLIDHVKELAHRQADLGRELANLSARQPRHSDEARGEEVLPKSLGETTALKVDLDRLSNEVWRLQRQVSRHETASDTRGEMQSTVSQYLGQLKAQLSQLEGVTQSLVERQNQLANHLETRVSASSETLTNRQALVKLARQLRQTQTAVQQLRQPTAPEANAMQAAQASWMVDIPVVTEVGSESPKLTGRLALEQAIDQAQRRLLVVWPWSRAVTIDEDLLKRFIRLLDRGCRLEIGWCHRGDLIEGRLMWRISQRWSTESSQLSQLKRALNTLLPLRENYPDHFRFQIMGTAESFLVCDNSTTEAPNNSFAILGLQSLATQSVTFPEVEIKLRSNDSRVVQGLSQRFRNPAIAPGDALAFFNRGTTRHDLRDQPGAISDYNRVLTLQPENAIVLNNRGAAQLELNHIDEAEIDFTEALNYNPKLFAAYCNRGWLRLEQNRFPAAVEDFNNAIKLKPHLPMAYVYRGSALQKLGDLKGAVRDYSDAIACGEPIALPYFYRSAAYQSQGDRERAIADLEIASARLEAQGDHHTLSSVQRQLSRLQHLTANG